MKVVEKGTGLYEFRYTVLWPALFSLIALFGAICYCIIGNDEHRLFVLVVCSLISSSFIMFMTERSVCRIDLVKGMVLIKRRLLIRKELKEFQITDNTHFFLMTRRGYALICLSPDGITKTRQNALHFVMCRRDKLETIQNKLNELIGKLSDDEQNITFGLHLHSCLRTIGNTTNAMKENICSAGEESSIIHSNDKSIKVVEKGPGVYEFRKNELSFLLFSLSCLAMVILVCFFLNIREPAGIVISSLIVLFSLLFLTEMSICRIDLTKGTILIKRRQLMRKECKEFPINENTCFLLLDQNGCAGVCLSPDGITRSRENALYFIIRDSDVHEKIKNRLNEILGKSCSPSEPHNHP